MNDQKLSHSAPSKRVTQLVGRNPTWKGSSQATSSEPCTLKGNNEGIGGDIKSQPEVVVMTKIGDTMIADHRKYSQSIFDKIMLQDGFVWYKGAYIYINLENHWLFEVHPWFDKRGSFSLCCCSIPFTFPAVSLAKLNKDRFIALEDYNAELRDYYKDFYTITTNASQYSTSELLGLIQKSQNRGIEELIMQSYHIYTNIIHSKFLSMKTIGDAADMFREIYETSWAKIGKNGLSLMYAYLWDDRVADATEMAIAYMKGLEKEKENTEYVLKHYSTDFSDERIDEKKRMIKSINEQLLSAETTIEKIRNKDYCSIMNEASRLIHEFESSIPKKLKSTLT